MKLVLIVALCVAAVLAVPVDKKTEGSVAQAEEKPAAEAALKDDADDKKTEDEAKGILDDLGANITGAVNSTDNITAAVNDTDTTDKKDDGRAALTESTTTELPAKEAAPSQSKDALQPEKKDAMAQVLNFVQHVAQPMSKEEQDALKDIISTGSEILVQAEQKARELSKDQEFQTLMQKDASTGIFGMHDGGLDVSTAVDQMTEVLSKMADPANPLTNEEKDVIHDLLMGFSKAFAPTKNTIESVQKDFEKMMGDSTASKRDELLGATTLLDLLGPGKTPQFDGKLLTTLTDKFLDAMEEQFKV
jgi:hypothetical protein